MLPLWEKFSVTSNYPSAKPDWLPYRHCTKLWERKEKGEWEETGAPFPAGAALQAEGSLCGGDRTAFSRNCLSLGCSPDQSG